mgnify:CR=1 FL=1
MTEEIQDIFDEIRNIMQPDMDCTARYHALDALLLRALKDRTRHSPVDFTHTAARLYWLCKQTGHPSHPLEVSVRGPDEYKRAFPARRRG